MLKITFKPESSKFLDASKSYTKIWKDEGDDIEAAIKDATKLQFKEKSIEAVVYEGISQSEPLKLRASYDNSTKKATLVHELLHRISADYMIRLPNENDDLSLGLHKQINLVLYDVWSLLYGQDFADSQVRIESARAQTYMEAWEWALNLSNIERQIIFIKLKHP